MNESTIVRIPSQNRDFTLPGTLDEQGVRNMIGSQVSGLSSMQASVTTEGGQQVVTFTQRTGNEG